MVSSESQDGGSMKPAEEGLKPARASGHLWKTRLKSTQ